MKKLLLIPVLALALVGYITSCDLPDTEIHIASGSFMTHVTQVSFINETSDQAAGKLLTELDGTPVEITGPDAEKVYNIEGNKGAGAFTIQGGALLLLLDPNIEFQSDEETYTVNLIVRPQGYLERNVPVTFVKQENNGSVEVALVKVAEIQNNDKVAIEKATSSIDASTKELPQEITLKADNSQSAEAGVTTEIKIPQGIKMKDDAGNVLSGTLEAEVVSFTETEEGTAFFPGGLMPDNIDMGKDENGNQRPSESGAFVSAGFTAVNMKVGGKRVSNFEGKKVAVTMRLGENTMNPETEEPYKVGDNVDIWSYETENGQWRFEKTGKVIADPNDSTKLIVEFETTHLSFFNLDYLGRGSVGRCYRSNLKINWPGLDRINKVNCRFTLKYVGGSRWSQNVVSKNSEVYDGKVITLKNAPQRPVEIRVYDTDNKQEIFKKVFGTGEICNGKGDINITVAPPVKKQMVTLKFIGKCDGSKVFPPVGTRVFYKKGTANSEGEWKQFHYVEYINRFDETIITDKVQIGETYTLKVYAGDKAYNKEITIQGTNNTIEIKVPDNICASLTKK
ncbi:MAG: hypothetical protein H6584_08920 [Flavobacteriales bacterium]|nr:hypothetical protein [Flavobacteriales bacterium]